MGDSDKKNLILAILLSVVVLMAWQFLYEAPRQEARQDAQQAQQALDSEAGPSGQSTDLTPQLGSEIPTELQSTADFPQSRDQALNETPRVTIESDRLRGSISLLGARIDDLVLKSYRETIEEDSDNIVLLTPHGGERPYYAEFSWLGKNTDMPNGASLWTADRTELTPEDPVTLRWTNDAGMVFEQEIALDENYLFTVTQRVTNGGDETISVSPFGLISRTGTPETLDFWILNEGLLGVFDETLEQMDYSEILEEGRVPWTMNGGWLGITDKYWLVALIPDQDKSMRASFNAQAPGGTEKYQVDFLPDAVSLAPRESFEMTSRLFAGARIATLLDNYGDQYGIESFDRAFDFGPLYFLTKPIYYAVTWLNGVLGNFGLAILALTVGIKLAFFPLANKSYKSMSKMKLLQPKMVELKERYGEDRQKLNTEMMELYKKEKVNPLSGCLPILVQIPVFFALYNVLFVAIEMRHAPFFGWIQDLSAPDPLGLLTGFGLFPWEVPAILAILNIGIWPVIMGLTMYLQQKLNPAPADPIQAKVFLLMPFFFTFLLGTFPAGLVIYWAWNNFLSIVQQYVIMRRMGVAIGGGKASDAGKS